MSVFFIDMFLSENVNSTMPPKKNNDSVPSKTITLEVGLLHNNEKLETFLAAFVPFLSKTKISKCVQGKGAPVVCVTTVLNLRELPSLSNKKKKKIYIYKHSRHLVSQLLAS